MVETEIFMKYLLVFLAIGVAVGILFKIFKIGTKIPNVDVKKIEEDILHAPQNYLEDFIQSFHVLRQNLWFFFILFALFMIDFLTQSLNVIFQKDIGLEKIRQVLASRPIQITQLVSMFLGSLGAVDDAYTNVYSCGCNLPNVFFAVCLQAIW